ncbi:MAG: TetR/AcrR family transcriptional regulator [Pseudomonadota bacterium]
MAPRRGFNDDEVAETAMRVFWEHGYRATSIDDLATASGLRKGSLHNAFGNKEDLFLLALDCYAKDLAERLDGALDNPDPAIAIPRFFDVVAARMTDPKTPDGCLTTAACAEFGDLPAKAKARVKAVVERTIEMLTHHAEAAIKNGLLPASSDPMTQANLWFAITRGMAALHKVTGDAAAIRALSQEAIKPLRAGTSVA